MIAEETIAEVAETIETVAEETPVEVEVPTEETVAEEIAVVETTEEEMEEEVEEEEIPVTEPVSEEEVQEAIAHVEEFLDVADKDLTPAQRIAKATYYRRLSTKERRKLKRKRRNAKK
ncbi:MAG: hypothetical protein IKZ28_05530, partial [Clostridia bacterium]|nr:hypothetical protein [Clostridia bacterium]